MENQVTEQTISVGKSTAIIAYLTVIGLIIAFIQNGEKKNPFASYHIRQCLGLVVTGFALGAIGVIPILGWFVSVFGMLFMIVLWAIGLMNALNGKMAPIPLLGEKYNEWFSGVQ